MYKSDKPSLRNLGNPPSTIGGPIGGISKPPTGVVGVAGSTLASGGGGTCKGIERSAGEKGRAGVDNCDKVAGSDY